MRYNNSASLTYLDCCLFNGTRYKVVSYDGFYRAGYIVPEIRKITNHHDNNIRKWIHRFNEKGVEGIISKIHTHKSIKFTDAIGKQIVEIATRNPRKYYGISFSTWSLLRLLAGFIMKDMKLIEEISHTR